MQILQIGKYDYRPPGQISDYSRILRQKGLIRHNLFCSRLADHGMQRPTRSEWGRDQNTHVTMC